MLTFHSWTENIIMNVSLPVNKDGIRERPHSQIRVLITIYVQVAR